MAKLRGVGYGMTVEKARQDAIKHIRAAVGYCYENEIVWGEAEIEVDFDYSLRSIEPDTRISMVRQEYTYDG